ncbi:MAG: hypothetical protein HY235_21725 [Acidobacteria bacterium]|nr:hypothetical protein [Acidobacteriota bacterium]
MTTQKMGFVQKTLHAEPVSGQNKPSLTVRHQRRSQRYCIAGCSAGLLDGIALGFKPDSSQPRVVDEEEIISIKAILAAVFRQ